MSIRNTFTLILIGVLAVMAASLSLAVRHYGERESRAEFARESAAQLDRVEDIIHLHFKNAEQTVKKLASLPETRRAALARKTAGASSETEDAALKQRLADLPALAPGVETAFCGYRDGAFHSSDPAVGPDGYDARTQSWYADTAWGLAEVSVTGIAISEKSKSLVATMASKIKDGGDVLGVAALTVSLSPLTDTLRDIRLGRSGRLALFDDKGRVLFDPNAQENLLRAADETDETMLALSLLPSGVHILEADATAFAAASRTLEGSRWKAVLFMDKAEQAAFGRRLIHSVVPVAAAVFLILTLIGTLLARNATRPLYALIGQSKALAEGNAEALARIPGRGPDIAALQGNIGMLIGRVMLLAQAEKQHAQELEIYARKAFRADQAEIEIREASEAANRNAAHCIAPIAADSAAAAAGLAKNAEALRCHTDTQTRMALDARAAAEILLNDAATMARQAAETEKSAEAALLQMRKTAKLVRDLGQALDAVEEAANVLPYGLHAFKTDAGQMTLLASSVRDIAEEVNLLGLNLSIEISGAGEEARKLTGITDNMRTLAEKIMGVAGAMDSAAAVFDQNQTAHTLAVNKNAAAVKRAAEGGVKAGDAVAGASSAAATVAEQIRVLSTALEGLAQPDVIGTENTKTALRAMETASETLGRMEESVNDIRNAASRLTALAAELEPAPDNGADSSRRTRP